MKTRIAITGMGILSPLGSSLEENWDGLLRGRSGIGPISRFDATKLPCRIAGEISELPRIQGLSAKDLRHLDPYTLYAWIASTEAVTQAGLEEGRWDRERSGIVIGSSRGGITTLETNWTAYRERNYQGISPFTNVSSLLNQAPAFISRHYRILGPSLTVSTACASGAHAIGEGVRMIRSGDADLVITGGSEAPITSLIIGGFAKARALSKRNDDPGMACRPFDRDRDGFVISEGASILVLEKWEHAETRGANILGEVLGYGMSSDAYHSTAPDPEGKGMARAMRLAMKDGGTGPDEIDLINAHGTGTVLNDRTEALALNKALGERARIIPVCAVKSMTGHMLGASGAFEVIASVMACKTGHIPPIRNLEHPDPECALHFVTGKAKKTPVQTVLTSSFAFGGANAALVVRGFPREPMLSESSPSSCSFIQ